MTDYDELSSKLYYPFFKCRELRGQLTPLVKKAKAKRVMSQKNISEIIGVSLTKIKEVENGTCKDINGILAYLEFLDYPLFESCDLI